MANHETIDPGAISTRSLHGLLLSSIAPRPIAFSSTIDKLGSVNLAPFSFFNVFSARPPILVFSPARRGRDNSEKDTYQNVKEVPEVVINTVNFDIVEQMSLASTEYPKGTNEFEKAGFTAIESIKVKPPRVKESPVSFECTVNEVKELGSNGGAGNLVICEVLLIHIMTKFLRPDGTIKSDELDMVARMGENYYSRTIPESIFEIPKPLKNLGIGVDSLPKSVWSGNILTGNDLGRLGNLPSLPSENEVTEQKSLVEGMTFDEIQALAKTKITEGNEREALILLMVAETL